MTGSIKKMSGYQHMKIYIFSGKLLKIIDKFSQIEREIIKDYWNEITAESGVKKIRTSDIGNIGIDCLKEFLNNDIKAEYFEPELLEKMKEIYRKLTQEEIKK